MMSINLGFHFIELWDKMPRSKQIGIHSLLCGSYEKNPEEMLHNCIQKIRHRESYTSHNKWDDVKLILSMMENIEREVDTANDTNKEGNRDDSHEINTRTETPGKPWNNIDKVLLNTIIPPQKE